VCAAIGNRLLPLGYLTSVPHFVSQSDSCITLVVCLCVAAVSRLVLYIIVQSSYSVSNSAVYWIIQGCAVSRDVTVECMMPECN
jgi:hypothetical protein